MDYVSREKLETERELSEKIFLPVAISQIEVVNADQVAMRKLGLLYVAANNAL